MLFPEKLPQREDMAKQIKTKERVSEFGEVFTDEREVKAMCDLVKDESERIESRVLEPACGNGNFLAEILNRKLATVSKFYSKQFDDWEKYSIVALSCLYGIDIMLDNVQECRTRLLDIWEDAHSVAVGRYKMPSIEDSAKYVLECNIICGDALTLLKADKTPIVFAEWSLISGPLIKRRDYELSTLLKMRDNGGQGDLFLSSDDYDKELGAYVPKPIREYRPIEYWRAHECLK